MSDESLAEYTERVIPSWCKNPEPPIDPDLAERVEYYIRRALELLDAVPRDDPFWAKTNKRATVYKADLWFGQVLEANPGDTEARWIDVAADGDQRRIGRDPRTPQAVSPGGKSVTCGN